MLLIPCKTASLISFVLSDLSKIFNFLLESFSNTIHFLLLFSQIWKLMVMELMVLIIFSTFDRIHVDLRHTPHLRSCALFSMSSSKTLLSRQNLSTSFESSAVQVLVS